MKELLKRWAAVEPERCHRTIDSPPPYYTINGTLYKSDGNTKGLQEEVQQAIEARWWDWKLHSVDYMNGEPRVYYATVLDGQKHGITRDSTSPCKALILAYIVAIQS